MKTFLAFILLIGYASVCAAEEPKTELPSISSADMDKEIIQHKGFVVLKITATWCPPCKALAPKLIELSKECSNIKFLQMDSDKNFKFVTELKVEALPTLILYKDGKELSRLRGNQDKADIIKWLNKYP